MLIEKPFADVKRQRFDGKHKGLHGHTGRRDNVRSGCECSACKKLVTGQTGIRRSHGPEVGRFSYPNDSYLFGTPAYRLKEKFLVTAFECDGLDTCYSLDRKLAWTAVPRIAQGAQHCSSVRQEDDRRNH